MEPSNRGERKIILISIYIYIYINIFHTGDDVCLHVKE